MANGLNIGSFVVVLSACFLLSSDFDSVSAFCVGVVPLDVDGTGVSTLDTDGTGEVAFEVDGTGETAFEVDGIGEEAFEPCGTGEATRDVNGSGVLTRELGFGETLLDPPISILSGVGTRDDCDGDVAREVSIGVGPRDVCETASDSLLDDDPSSGSSKIGVRGRNVLLTGSSSCSSSSDLVFSFPSSFFSSSFFSSSCFASSCC